ncbi:MAG: hypothetical protein ACRCXZ_06955 [Patescibacteria group bacterium]
MSFNLVKTWLVTSLIFAFFGATLTSCSPPKSASQRVDEEVEQAGYSLKDDERILAKSNAKEYFEKEWPTAVVGKEKVRGTFISCRPADSNTNGYVTCTGYKISPSTAIPEEIKMYCGYKPNLVGCTDEDKVK